ncbi:hypothetical protein COU01_01745 [Candidatus Falkowbacteria bacterium CG10_big_fil_rev_8_21_14_0_10_44_15]|uniref:Uncharacterized protein n=1 Tax=Candidatus Falkowbacteria bacterium CG10_big_fil_rev_8_21_14_0_10_44_15 TaxID=1974569 RepID=A0A2H0V049_9BACT|nr:MAG: hypothetical protein COU01_01745 [Candidatus Falkowbacteria bacterium CG10_big_fil_rev_8_21_14_0_10_44_15]
MKKILHLLLDFGYVLIAIFTVSFYKVMVSEGFGLSLRRILLIGFIWLIVGIGIYKLTNWLSKRVKLNLTIANVIGWLNLVSWIIGFLGLIVSSSTIALVQLFPDKQGKFFSNLAYISLLLSFFNMIAGGFSLDSYYIGLASFGVGFLYILFAIATYLFSVRVNKRKIVGQLGEEQNKSYQPSKYKFFPVGGLLLIIVSLGLFYWYEIRPAKIKHDCSWIKQHSDAIPEKQPMTKEELLNAGLIEDCDKKYLDNEYSTEFFGNISKELCQKKVKSVINEYSSYKPYEPAKEWKVKASNEEYEFCLHDKGL